MADGACGVMRRRIIGKPLGMRHELVTVNAEQSIFMSLEIPGKTLLL